MEQNEKARYKKWFPFTTYDLDELNNRDMQLMSYVTAVFLQRTISTLFL